MTRINRRTFLRTASAVSLAGAELSATASRAAELPKRKFVMNPFPNLIGVNAKPHEAIKLAQQYGYQSVTPLPWVMVKYSEDELSELVAAMKNAGLRWGASLVWPFCTCDEVKFKEKRREMSETAKVLERAGVTRCFTWTGPGSDTLTYVANFRRHVQQIGGDQNRITLFRTTPSAMTRFAMRLAFDFHHAQRLIERGDAMRPPGHTREAAEAAMRLYTEARQLAIQATEVEAYYLHGEIFGKKVKR